MLIKCASELQNIEQNGMKKRRTRPKLKHTQTHIISEEKINIVQVYVHKYREKNPEKARTKINEKKSTTTALNSQRKKSITSTHTQSLSENFVNVYIRQNR